MTMLTSFGARTITLRTPRPSMARWTFSIGQRQRLQLVLGDVRATPPAGPAPCPAPGRRR